MEHSSIHTPTISHGWKIVSYAILCINRIPVGGDVSSTLYIHTIRTGTTLDLNKHTKIEFDTYAKIYDPPKSTSSMKSSTGPCILIVPTGNIQGSKWFLNLRAIRHIKRYTFNPLLITPHIIDWVHELDNKEN